MLGGPITRVLITGGAGFFGSHLAEALLNNNHQVFILDDLSTGSIENIRDLRAHPGLQYWIDSVKNRPLLAELVDECDVIVHMAAAVGVRLIVESPVHTIETNVNGTEIVLQAASKGKYSSSLLPSKRSMERVRACPSARRMILSSGLPRGDRGATRPQKRSMNSWR